MGRPIDAREMKVLVKFRNSLIQLNAKNGRNVYNYVIGCSGGTDSVALLLCAYYLNKLLKFKYNFICVYIDHGLRPVEDEIEFVADLCGLLDIPFKDEAVDLSIYKDNNVEAVGRTARYELLNKVGKEYFEDKKHFACSCFRVLTAHHEKDQAETILMGILGLVHSMPGNLKKISKCNNLLNTWRPLLDIPREELEYMVRDFKVIEDPTNTDIKFKRNLVRHKVLPALKNILGDNIEAVIASKAGE